MYVAVVTGASKGIGEEFARQIAVRRQNILMVARSEERLEKLAKELQQRHRIRAVPFACDLAEPGAAKKVFQFLRDEGMHPTWLVNNAGFGMAGGFDSMNFEKIHQMMMLNMVALTELTHLLLPQLRLGRNARIINVASTAAFQPIPYFNVYAASKTFVLHFGEALYEELRHTDVRVLTVCPGPTPTNFHETAEMKPEVFERGQTAQEVVRMALEASDRRRCVMVTQRQAAIVAEIGRAHV